MNTENRKRNKEGKFTQKSHEAREVRSLRLTNSTWEKLGNLAEKREITRADVIEDYFIEEAVNKKFSKIEIQKLVEDILNDQQITRKGKDRGAIKRGLEALIEKIYPI